MNVSIEIRAAEIIQELHECKRLNIPTQTITIGERIGWIAAKYSADRYDGEYRVATYYEWWAGWLAFEATKDDPKSSEDANRYG